MWVFNIYKTWGVRFTEWYYSIFHPFFSTMNIPCTNMYLCSLTKLCFGGHLTGENDSHSFFFPHLATWASSLYLLQVKCTYYIACHILSTFRVHNLVSVPSFSNKSVLKKLVLQLKFRKYKHDTVKPRKWLILGLSFAKNHHFQVSI